MPNRKTDFRPQSGARLAEARRRSNGDAADKLIAKRKAAYEAVYPETKQGGSAGKAGGGKAKSVNLAGFA
jgi:hypothetical protein